MPLRMPNSVMPYYCVPLESKHENSNSINTSLHHIFILLYRLEK